MALDWPTFPCEKDPEVEIIGGRTETLESEAGTVWPLSLWTGTRYRFTFNYRGLRSNRAAPGDLSAYSEIGAVVYLIQQLQGGAGLVNVVNPLTGSPVLCRLESDGYSFQKVAKCPWYKGTVSFRSV